MKKAAKKDDEKEFFEAEEEEKKGPATEEIMSPSYKTFDNQSMTLFDIFGVYGCDLKSELKEKPELTMELWYDFKPYNSKDPVLLSLMHKDWETGRTM